MLSLGEYSIWHIKAVLTSAPIGMEPQLESSQIWQMPPRCSRRAGISKRTDSVRRML
jgi:hypothetical protein